MIMKPLHSAFAVTALVAVGMLGYWLTRNPNSPPSGPPVIGQTGAGNVRPKPSVDLLGGAIQSLGGGTETIATLHELQSRLAAMPKEQAVGMIRDFLAGGRDRPTGLPFEIAADGKLSEWPTFRTFLLDAVANIDPAAAAAISRKILGSPTSADEWAIALRNVARHESADQSRDYLRGKTEELIRNPAWQETPSVGYLNAFDVLVHIGATESTPLLSELIQRKDRKDLAHAGFLTLDRLVQRQTPEVLNRLAADTRLQQNRPEMVAQQFARADLRDATQRDLVRRWLLDPQRTAVELRSFAGVFPNNNRFISHNLLTDEAGQTGDVLVAHDREVLQTVSDWAEDPAFAGVKPHLDQMISRLQGFLGVGNGPTPPGSAAASTPNH